MSLLLRLLPRWLQGSEERVGERLATLEIQSRISVHPALDSVFHQGDIVGVELHASMVGPKLNELLEAVVDKPKKLANEHSEEGDACQKEQVRNPMA